MSALLQLVGLRKAFGRNRVTDDLTLDIEAGELHAIIGPNGAGKTTLIHQISGVIASDAGRIVYDGKDITPLPMHARARAGLVRSFQIVSIFPALSVRQNVALAAQSTEGSSFRFFGPVDREARIRGKADRLLEAFAMSSLAEMASASLSHGEKRQLELAVTLATEPKLLLLDEPLAGLGRDEASGVVTLLRRIKERTTIVLVEHDMDAVFALADRVSVLGYGKLIASGPPAAIRRDPEVRRAYLGDRHAP